MKQKFPGTFVPRERKVPGTKVPGTFVPRERKVSGTKVPHRDYSFLGTKGLGHGHTKICRHHGTHGTDVIGCRRGKGGASTGVGAVRDQCHVTKLKELYRHPGAIVCWQKYSPYCYNAEVTNKRWKPTMSDHIELICTSTNT